MKKVLFILLTLSCSLYVFAGTYPEKELEPRFSLDSYSTIDKMTKADSTRQQKPVCHACCKYSVTSADGTQTITTSACGGWLLTSCETAAERACERARIAAIYAAFR
jgi:hypothetical protein